MDFFDQNDEVGQNWLLFFLEQRGCSSFDQCQDIADLLHGLPVAEIEVVLDRYASMKRLLTVNEFLRWMRSQRAARGIHVADWWQDAQDRVRIAEQARQQP